MADTSLYDVRVRRFGYLSHYGRCSDWHVLPFTGRWMLKFDENDNATLWLEVITCAARVVAKRRWLFGKKVVRYSEVTEWVCEDHIRITKKPFIGDCKAND